MATIGKYNKVVFSGKDKQFVLENFYTMTNQQLADSLGLKLTIVRSYCYSLGLKKMELEYWTTEQVKYLRKHYKKIGDVEIAEYFNANFPKNKGWNKKHIEKKRRYLKLKRTQEEINLVRARNAAQGRHNTSEKMWATRGVNPIGTVLTWSNYGREFKVIKTHDGYVDYKRWLYELKYGKIPNKMNLTWKAGLHGIYEADSCELKTDAEMAAINSKNRIKYPIEIKRAIAMLNKLNKQIKTQENGTKQNG